MLSVSVQKDITEYKPKIVGQLTLRSLVCSVIAVGVGVAVGAYCYLVLGLGYDVSMFGIILLSLPIWACGFWHPYGMNLEEFVPLWLKHNLGNNIIKYKSSGYVHGGCVLSNAKQQQKANEKQCGYKVTNTYKMMCKRPDFEAYRPFDEYKNKEVNNG